MSINSVQLYAKGLLDGLPLPVAMGGPAGAGGDVLTALVTPPVVDYRTTPRAYIWGSTGYEDASTMPSPSSFKKVTHKLDIWITCFASINDFAGQDSVFPSVLEAVMQKLRSTPKPVEGLLDTETGRTSDLLNFGQHLTWDYAPVRAVEEGSDIARFDGRITVKFEEWLHA